MSDKPKPNKGELIPSIDRSLARKKSGLVKRGLELIHELKKQQVRVLIGNFDDHPINDLFSEIIKAVIKNKYYLKVLIFFYGEEIMEIADKESIDIFILLMGNIRFYPVYSSQVRLQNSLQLLTQIKTKYGSPVIALYSGSPDSSLTVGAKLYSDFFFTMPFEPDAFKEAIEKCFDMLPRFDEVSRKSLKVSERPTTT